MYFRSFEKYIGGKYLGELARIIMEHLVKRNLLFKKASFELFPTSWKFGTDNISLIEQLSIIYLL